MSERAIDLAPQEWIEVSSAFEDSWRGVPKPPPAPGTLSAILQRIAAFILGPLPPEEPDNPRRQAVRRFVAATAARRDVAEEHIPTLLALGLNRRQIHALAMLTVPGRREI